MKTLSRQIPMIAAVVIILMLALGAVTASASEDNMAVVFVNLPDEWQDPHMWAWDDDGNNAFAAWPGGELEVDPSNPEWHFIHVPQSMTNVIISTGDGNFQTDDHQIESLPVWITVHDEFDVEVTHESQTEGYPPAYVRRYAIHARVPADWENVSIWAWLAPEGINAFESWPGLQMRSVAGGWYTARVPYWVNSIIINGNNGEVQTEDLDIELMELWVVVSDDFEVEISADNPDLRVDNITVRAQVPDGWNAPNLWAWSHPDGTNVFPAWPGEPLQFDGTWYTMEVPGWINSLIVNANNGDIQTSDMRVTAGQDVWILVLDDETYIHDYVEITEIPEPTVEEPEEADEADEVAEQIIEYTVAPITETETGSVPVAVIVIAILAVVGIIVVVSVKTRKK